MQHTNHTTQKTALGFWIYLMSDCVLFAALFATYAVLHNATFSGPTGEEIFSLPFVLGETLLLLTSSFTCGLAILAARGQRMRWLFGTLLLTCILGLGFVSMELYEFSHLMSEGSGPQASAFLSSFFALVGTHGLHVSVGLLWLLTLMTMIYRRGLTAGNARKLLSFSLFWHFLDVIWICIFTFVYIIGVL